MDAIYDAAIAGHADAIAILEMQADRLDFTGRTILHVLSEEGNTELLLFILRQFPNKNLLVKLDDWKETALHLAADYGHTKAVEVLIDAARHLPPSDDGETHANPVTSFQAFLRQPDYSLDTALHIAVQKGHASIVKLLVDADPSDTHTQNDRGKTPMYIAVEQGFNDIVEIISTTCIAPSLDGPDGSTALRIKHLDQGKNPGGSLYKIMDRHALYVAAVAGDADAIAGLEMLTGILNGDEETILHIESKKRYAERLRFILREFAKKNLLATLTSDKGTTALHLAAINGHTGMVEILIDAARDLPPPPANDSPVTSSANESTAENPVTSFQAFLRQVDHLECTALHLAVMENKAAIVKLLVDVDASDTHIQNKEGKTPMYIAVEKGYNKIAEIIFTSCTAPSLDGPDCSTVMLVKNLDGEHVVHLYKIMDKAALYAAAIAGDADAIAKLDEKADRPSENDKTILHIESEAGNTEHVQFILRQFACKNLLVKLTKHKHTALHLAAYAGYTKVAEVIIHEARRLLSSSSSSDDGVTSFQAFLRQGDKEMDTALHAAVMNRHASIVKLLVDADPSDTHTQNDRGKTPMYIAVEKGFNDIVEIISTTCIAPCSVGPDGSTALRIKNLDQDKSPGGTLYKLMDKDAVYAAAITGDADAIAGLEMQADRMNQEGETILHVESEHGNTENVRFIVEKFANKNLLVMLAKRNERTALHLAAKYGHTEVAKILIDTARNLPPPSSPNDNNQVTSFQAFLRQPDDYILDTALHKAVKKGHASIVKLLVEADPSYIHTQNSFGETPINMAVKSGYTDIVKMICTTTCTANLYGPGGSTVLHAVIRDPKHDNEVVEVLIGAARLLFSSSEDDHNTHSALSDDGDRVTPFQAFLRQSDHKDMNTALHIAVMQDNLATAKLLVEADPSDPHKQNNEGKTPMYIAAERRYYDIVKMICTTCTAPSPDGPGGSTVLHAVIKNLNQGRKEEDRDMIKVIIEGFKRSPEKPHGYDREGELAWFKRSLEKQHIFYREKRLAGFLNRTDENKCSILELAVDGNYLDVVQLIIEYNPYLNNSMRYDFIGIMPLIYKAKDKEHKDMVNFLTATYRTGVQNSDHTFKFGHKAQLLSAIESRKEESSVFSLLDDHRHAEYLVTFADNLGWTALHHAAYHEFDSIIKVIIEAEKKLGRPFVYEEMITTPFHVAAQKGNTSTVIRLMELWPSWSSAYLVADRNGQNILHLAALQSKKDMILGILKYCPEKYKRKFVNEPNNNGDTPLHLLISRGCFVHQLLTYEGLDIRVGNEERWTPADMLYFQGEIIDDQVQIKIALDGIQQIDPTRDIFSSSVPSSKRERKDAIFHQQAELMKLKKYEGIKQDTPAITKCVADAIAGDPISRAALEMKADTLNESGETILHVESKKGHIENVRFIVSAFPNKSLLGKLDGSKQTALHLAAQHGHTQVVEDLIDAARLLPSFQDFIRQVNDPTQNSALHLAVMNGNVAIVKLLVEADPNHSHVQNKEGKTSIYIAAESGNKDIVKEICTICPVLSLDGPGGRTTTLHAVIKNIGQATGGAMDMIRMMVQAAKRWSSVQFEALFSRTDESGSTVLQLAMERNYADAVELILQEDPAYQPGGEIKRNGLMRLIYEAIDKKYSHDIIELLANAYEAGIDPEHKGVLDLILGIKSRDEESVLRLLGNAQKLVTFAEDNGWTPLHYAVYHEFDSILGAIIKVQKDVGHPFVYGNTVITPFHVAVKHGYTSTMIRLMQSWPAPSSGVTAAAYSPYTAVDENDQNILHLAAVLDNKDLAAEDNKAADNKKKMVQSILKYCPEEYKDTILKQQDTNGDTPLHLLISHGCFIPELIKHGRLDTMPKNKNNFTPWDMLYFKSDVVADQVHIKMALDKVQTHQPTSNLWAKSTEKKMDSGFKSMVLDSKRRIKDVKFDECEKSLRDAKHERKKKDLEVYKMRTNTQIIVTALITTVTFTVGFTMPGGLRQSGGVDEGLVLLSKKKLFNAFMVSDALALLLSTSSLFFYFLESMSEDPRQVSKLNAASTVLNIVSVMAMMLTFITGTCVVLSHSPAIAITVCVIGSLFFLLIIVMLIKIVCDRQVKRNED